MLTLKQLYRKAFAPCKGASCMSISPLLRFDSDISRLAISSGSSKGSLSGRTRHVSGSKYHAPYLILTQLGWYSAHDSPACKKRNYEYCCLTSTRVWIFLVFVHHSWFISINTLSIFLAFLNATHSSAGHIGGRQMTALLGWSRWGTTRTYSQLGGNVR